ncbi:MAG: insulinase family protein [Deltaproteobacteria bacterium]|jgi:zinc protease|nr:insulinase family protein [Deltaproteobacteria bacterium]
MFFMVPGLIEAPKAQGGIDVSYVLDNGLKVIMVPQPGNPTVTVLVNVKAGSASESGESEYGLAHLMEHMAFKGTKKRGVGEVSAEVENNGGMINAYTSTDDTVYHLTLPVDQLELGLDILADIVFDPLYDPKEYALEKEVVVEEIKRSEDGPDRQLWIKFMAEFFKDHPYAHPVLGTAQTVREATREVALDFHDKFYRPDNAFVVIAGGFNPDDVYPIMDKYYAGLKNPGEPIGGDLPIAQIGVKDGPGLIVMRNPMVQVPKVLIGFKVPPADSPEAPQLDLLSALMDLGRSARLVENVKNKKGLVTDISTSSMAMVLGGFFMVSFETEPEKINPALAAVVEELSALASTPPASDELSRARALAASSYLASQESSNTLAYLLSNFERATGDYRLRDAYLPQWGRMTATDLVKLVEKYFVPQNMLAIVMIPEGFGGFDEAGAKTTLASLKPVFPAADAGVASAFQPVPIKGPAKLYVQRDATVPLVSVKISFMGGLLGEGKGEDGYSNLMSNVMAMAPKDMTSEDFARFVEGMGASISGYSGRNSMGVNGTFIASNWETGLESMFKVLSKPAFAQNNLEEFRAETLATLKLQREQLTDRTFNALRDRLYGDHPYHLNNLGDTESVSAATAKGLSAYHDRLIRPENMYIVVAGDIDPNIVAEAVDRYLADWKAPRAKNTKVAVPDPPKPITDGPVKLADVEETAQQTHLAIAFLTPGMGSPDQAPLEVLDSYLSGLGGLLFNELRNQQSLAYAVGSSFNPGLKTGAFNFYIATDPQKTGQATAGMLDIIGRLRANPLTDEQVQGAIRYLRGQRLIARQTLSSRADEFVFNVLYGLGPDFEKRHLAEIEAVTPGDILRVAKDYLDPASAVISLVGNEASTDQAFGNWDPAPKAPQSDPVGSPPEAPAR